MEKIDQKVLEKQISTVYAAQTKKVQELLETVALELNKKEKKEILFTLDRNKAKQMYHVGKVVNKTKDEKRNMSSQVQKEFEKMNEKLDLNAKNLDYIFSCANERENQEMQLLQEIAQNQRKWEDSAKNEIEKNQTKQQGFIIEVKEELLEYLTQIKVENDQQIEGVQQNLKSYYTAFVDQAQKGIEELKGCNQSQTENVIEEFRKETDQVGGHISELESKIKQYSQQIQEEMKQNFYTLKEEFDRKQTEEVTVFQNWKQEMIQAYEQKTQKEKEEQEELKKQLQSKDHQIEELKYQLYEYHQKVKRLENKKHQSIWNSFWKQMENEEEQIPICQIINYVTN